MKDAFERFDLEGTGYRAFERFEMSEAAVDGLLAVAGSSTQVFQRAGSMVCLALAPCLCYCVQTSDCAADTLCITDTRLSFGHPKRVKEIRPMSPTSEPYRGEMTHFTVMRPM